MTRVALDIESASHRLALRRWLEARGDEVCTQDDAEIVLGPTHAPVPIVGGSDGTRIDFNQLAEQLAALRPPESGLIELGAPSSSGLIAQSVPMQELEQRIAKLADAGLAVLIRGESGSGKEVVARALHERGGRSGEPFIAVNCAAIVDGLFESELFGHEKGSFTDAVSQRRGHFERTGAGTLFLDEIGELPPAIQAKLLRVLQEHRFSRVGGADEIGFGGRVVSATALDLAADPTFRPDLFHRIAGAVLQVPPLRERAADLPELCRLILARAAGDGHVITHYEPGLIGGLAGRPWPGNVRQLENVLRQAAIFAESGVLRAADLDAVGPTGGPDPDRLLMTALRAWLLHHRQLETSGAELREGLLERLRAAEDALDPGPGTGAQGADGLRKFD